MPAEHGGGVNRLTALDARIKLVLALLLIGLIISFSGFSFPLIATALCFWGCMYLRVPPRVFLLRFSEPLFIVSMLVLLKMFFSGREPFFVFEVWGFRIAGYLDGLRAGALIAARILGAVSVAALLGFSTPFSSLMAALSWLRAPRGLVEILMLAYRYVFVIFEDAQVIYNAQKNRLGYASVRRGLDSFGILTGSLVLKAFDRSSAITVSMVQRGYDGDMPMLSHRPFRGGEVVAGLLVACVMGAAWKIL